MNSSNLYSDIHASLLKFCYDLSQKLTTVTGKPVGTMYFDAYADDERLPEGDFVGMTGLSFETDAQTLDGSFMIGFTVQTDKNLFRLVKGVNEIFSALTPGRQVEVVDAGNGFSIGGLSITDGTRVMPVGGKAGRPVQLVVANFQTPVNFRLPR